MLDGFSAPRKARRKRQRRRGRRSAKREGPNQKQWQPKSIDEVRRCEATKLLNADTFDQAISSSQEVQECLKSKNDEVVAFICNISFSIQTAKQLAEVLMSRMPEYRSSIIRCELLRERKGRNTPHSGGARVTFSSAEAFDYALGRDLTVERRAMHISKDRFQPPPRMRDIDTKLFTVSKLQVGHTLGNGEFVMKWQSDPNESNIEFLLNGRNTRQMAIELDCNSERYRIETALKNVTPSSVVCSVEKATNEKVVMFVLERPPLCFRNNQVRLKIGDSFMDLILDGMGFGDLLWDTAGSKAAEASPWIRTTDPTGSAVFGRYLTYRITISSSESIEKLFGALHRFGLKPKMLTRTVESHRTDSVFDRYLNVNGSLESDSDDWSGGYDVDLSSLTFDVRYMLHVLLSSHRLAIPSAAAARELGDALQAVGVNVALDVLHEVLTRGRQGDAFEVLMEDLAIEKSEGQNRGLFEDEDNSSFYASNVVRRVLVTPLRLCPQPPEPDMSNRILRNFKEHANRFIRVVFVDENEGSIFQAISKGEDVIEKRVRHLVDNGILVAGEKFVFLAYSNSQLREQSCWFYNEGPTRLARFGANKVPTAEDIRRSMGDLKNVPEVGKYAARLGQGFSSSVETVRLGSFEWKTIDDVKSVGDKYCFSDGVGVISPELAARVFRKYCEREGHDKWSSRRVPSAFQIRFQGCKGVVSVLPDTCRHILPKPCQLAVRKSMVKFKGNPEHRTLEVLSVAKPIRCYLNRQIIPLLTARGVPDNAIMELVDGHISQLNKALTSNSDALRLLKDQGGPGTSIAVAMLKAGFDVKTEPHLGSVVRAVRRRQLADVQARARVPVAKAVCLMGVMDETGLLPEGCVFYQFSSLGEDGQGADVVRCPNGRPVLVYRNPSLHVGDVRVLLAFDVPQLSHLVDVVVFPQKGSRPHPNEMSGGDLDGDLYAVIYDEGLVSAVLENFPEVDAMDFTPPDGTPLTASNENGRVTSDEVRKFFVDFMKNYNVGKIANAHVVMADASDEGAWCSECIKLAGLHSIAVDFCKTGIPAVVDSSLRISKYPHFMENETKMSYKSTKVLGQIYDRLVNAAYSDHNSYALAQKQERWHSPWDPDLLLPGIECYESEAREHFENYSWELFEIMQQYQLVHDDGEAELVSGCVTRLSRKLQTNNDAHGGKLGEDGLARLNRVLRELYCRYVDAFVEGLSIDARQNRKGLNDHEQEDEDEEDEEDETDFSNVHMLKKRFLDPVLSDDPSAGVAMLHKTENWNALVKASAWYKVTYAPSKYTPLFSFAWVVHAPLCAIKRLKSHPDLVAKKTARGLMAA